MATQERNPFESKAWCHGVEHYANCGNCYRDKCERRQAKPVVGLGTATSLGQLNFNTGRRMGGRPMS